MDARGNMWSTVGSKHTNFTSQHVMWLPEDELYDRGALSARRVPSRGQIISLSKHKLAVANKGRRAGSLLRHVLLNNTVGALETTIEPLQEEKNACSVEKKYDFVEAFVSAQEASCLGLDLLLGEEDDIEITLELDATVPSPAPYRHVDLKHSSPKFYSALPYLSATY